MDKMTEQHLEVIKNDTDTMRCTEVIEQRQSACQTNPIARKLLDFSNANNTKRFSVRDLFKR